MISCEKIQEMISSMLDGELSETDRAIVCEHIAECPQCAAMYEDFAALSRELGDELSHVPADLHSKIMKGVRTSPRPKKPIIISLRPYLSAAACLVVVIGALLALRPGSSESIFSVGSSSQQSPAVAAAPFSKKESADAEFAMPAAPAAPAEPAEPAAPPDPAAPAEPAEPAESEFGCYGELAADLSSDMSLNGFIAYKADAPIDEAWFMDFTSKSEYGTPQMQRILFPEKLSELLSEENTNETFEEPDSSADAIVRLRLGDEFTTIKLHFVGETIIVETSEGFYTATGTPEEFLSIN